MDGGKKGSVEIDISPPPPVKNTGGGSSTSSNTSPSQWIWDVLEFAMEDTNRVTFSLKVGFACLLVSLLILIRHPYEFFGTNIVWALITVAIMFEYTVGATFNRGFNRALGSLFAGIFAVVSMHIAASSGSILAPYIIAFSIFLVGAITSFMKLWPSLVPYEYGFRVILLTYCLIVANGYNRVGDAMRTSVDRLYSVAIGGVVTVLVNVLLFPIWAGEQLHKELIEHFDLVADSLQECVKKYLNDDGTERPEFLKTVMDDFHDEPAYRKCRAILKSSSALDSLASSAKWEPPHGRFRHFFYPWAEYVSVGSVLRHCAYEVMAMHGCLHSEIQAPYSLRCAFRADILDTATRAAELLRSLSEDIYNMKRCPHPTLLNHVHNSTERLQRSIDLHSYLLTSSQLSLDREEEDGDNDDDDGHLIEVVAINVGAFKETTVTKQHRRRLRSWPSVEAAELEDGAIGLMQRRSFERSTAALSLATFTSLLVEFVARLDHLVEAVDKLGRLAKFKHEIVSS
ncbi:aluminum-activated malate transporter 9-like [Zingiber officinale]|uniref:aluminum-activated malate transporter 9-like n=1 Tax=Zingiber officinale TaxID=94328 RepID=UPI001C4C73CB|nr:aluminum-activated malate transporter 9-like [Zingiber officinale]